MQLLDDNPSIKDLLGFNRMVDILDGVIRNPPRLPFTIGVFGTWGSGKSTLMGMIRDRLGQAGLKTVWFNAWKYDGKEVIWNALIQEIFYTMQRDPEVKARDRSREFHQRVVEAARKLALYAARVSTRLIPGGIVKEEDVDKVVEALRPSSANDELFDFINRFEDTFDNLVKEYVGTTGYLVIFIDDLDRCLPENAVTVLEALKLYLDRTSCVFVIGVESSIVEEAINQRYRNNPRLSGKDYLEKIIHLPFMVPRVEGRNVLSLLDPYADILSYRDDDLVTKLILEGTEHNPRRVKRFVNAFCVLSKIAGGLPADHRRLLAKILLVQMRFPALYNALLTDMQLIQTITDWLAQSPDERTQSAKQMPEPVKALLVDASLRTFLDRTSDIPCPAEQIERWVRLAKGEVAGAA